jgi:hypothetical protein
MSLNPEFAERFELNDDFQALNLEYDNSRGY